MQLSEVQLDTPGKILESHQMSTATLRTGERGVKDLVELPDGRIRVVGEKVTYHLYPSHVVWTVPAASQHCPVLSSSAAGAVSDLSAVAQSVEHPTVTGNDKRSNPFGGAVEPAKNNEVQSGPLASPDGEVAAAKVAVEANGDPVRSRAPARSKPEAVEVQPAQPDDVSKPHRRQSRAKSAKSARSKTA